MHKQMKIAAEQRDFETAARLRDKLRLIAEITSPEYRLKPDLVLPQLQDSLSAEATVQLRKLLRNYIALPPTFSVNRIEGYDVSNTQGREAAVAMVVFEAGQGQSSEYRLFNIKSLQSPNDYHMMKEALLRRQNHPEWSQADLVLIDGGRGQLRAALSVWQWPGIVISLVKNPDRIVIPTKINREKKRLQIDYKIVHLPDNHPALRLLQSVRDEAHRFSKKQHSRLHQKKLLGVY